MNVGKRFDIALEKVLGYKRNSTAIANEYEVTTQAISQLKKNEKSNDLMRKIAKDKGISLSWLEFGKGNMLEDETASTVNEPNSVYGNKETVTLEYYPETYASAGGGAYPYLEDSAPMTFSRRFLQLHLGLSNFKNIFILNTSGESMEPTLKNGSLIFVNPIENEDNVIRDGAIYVIMCDNTMLVKRVTVNPITKAYTLVSDHAKHENITIDFFHESGCKFLGRVVGSFDRV